MNNIENNVAAQAGDEPMRAAFWKFVATLPIPMQDTISTSEARGESLTATAFASGYRVAQVSPRATADVEQVMMDCLIALSIGYIQTNDAGDEICPDCDMEHVGPDHSPGCLVLRARAARAQLAAIATTKPGA